MAALEKMDLAKYIISKYRHAYNEDIRPIKLQKTLYFLFAYYGGWISKAKEGNTEITDELQSTSKYLFNAKFAAWDYGPVEEDIYRFYKNKPMISEKLDDIIRKLETQDKNAVKFIDGFIEQILRVNDFSLVSISHQDHAWKSKYHERKPGEIYQAEYLDKDEIIKEYAEKV